MVVTANYVEVEPEVKITLSKTEAARLQAYMASPSGVTEAVRETVADVNARLKDLLYPPF